VDLPPDPTALRRLVLALVVLDAADVEPYGEGVVLRGGTPVEVGWAELASAVGSAPVEGPLARRLAQGYLRTRRLLADLTADELARRARPVGLPVDHALHPGPSWAREHVLGGVLDLGLGLVVDDDSAVEVLAPQVLAAADMDADPWWPPSAGYLERMESIAVEQVRREKAPVLRPIGDCDVVTLLGSALLRAWLCEADGTGLRTVAVPMRRRGWLDLSRIDPAFVRAAALLTEDHERGFTRPLLITADEVVLANGQGDSAALVLLDPAVEPLVRDVRYR
jgi:hypothetical protein